MLRLKSFLVRLPLVVFFFALACDSSGATPSQAAPVGAQSSVGARFTSPPATLSSYASSYASNITQRDYTESMQSGGLARTYYIHLPFTYTGQEAVPLVLAFHGSGATGKALAVQSHLNDVSDAEGFIIVYPDGYQGQWADGRGTTPPEQAGVDDVAFVSALIDKLSGELAIDTSRVYVTGMSNGGIFAQRLACQLANKITAIASVSGTIAENISQQCQPARPVPVLLFMGTDDTSVPFEGGEVDGNQGVNLSAAATVQLWMTLNACSSTPVVTQAPSAPDDGTYVFRTRYGSCKNHADVILYTIEDGVHTWPGESSTVHAAEEGNSLDASRVIWKFFQHHP